MSAGFTRDSRDVEALERELADLRTAHQRLADAAEQVRREAAEAARELRDALERQRYHYEEAMAAAAAIAAMNASNTGRLVRATERLRLRLRGTRMAWRSLRGSGRRVTRKPGVPRAVAAAPLGVNVAGYINAESGLGEATRAAIRALQVAGIPVALNNVRGPQRSNDRTFVDFVDAQPHPFNLIHLNADNMAWFAGRQGRAYYRDRYSIGYWFWELESFRRDWESAFNYVDEVWVASDHTRRSIAEHATVPVVHVPLGIERPVPGDFGRAHFGLPDRAFIFMYTFDVSSQMERKNPFGAIRAFRLAGFEHDQAVLLLKYTNGHINRPAVRRLAEAASGLNVVMIDGVMDRPELNALVNCSDCCLSLHRAEGYGMTIAEAMALGKPAIATNYSANVEFMTPEVSRLVNYRMVTLTRDFGPYLRGFRWAEPDVEHAAQQIREVALTPGLGAELGERGRRHVGNVLSTARTAAIMRGRLEQLRS